MHIPDNLPDVLCEFRVGQRVQVTIDRSDWPGLWIITGIRWEYQRGEHKINIEIASEDEIQHGMGATDGWNPSDLAPA